MIDSPEMQKTLIQPITISGRGIFSGAECSIRICPASTDTGIIFQKVDLPGKPEIPALLEFVQESSRCTRIGIKDASILMVEHLLSTLYACGIDNARIEVSGPEIPGCDGSSKLFVEEIKKAGLETQNKEASTLTIDQPVFLSRGDIHLVALPSEEYKLSYTMHYPQSPLLNSQFYSFCMNSDRYEKEIAPCRTFSLYEEILPFIKSGVIKGGGLENALVIQGDKFLNPEGARFPDEMVRHKILDLIGDLSLIGARIRAHIIAICSGHATNVAFAKMLLSHVGVMNV